MEQNTDRMWWTIGAVLLGGILIAGAILLLKTTLLPNITTKFDEIDRPTVTHTAYSWSGDGTDRFTTTKPNLNLLKGTKTPKSITGNNNINQGALLYSFDNNNTLSNQGFIINDTVTLEFDWSATNPASGSFRLQWQNIPWGFNAPIINLSSTNSSGHVIHTFTIGNSEIASTAVAGGMGYRLDYVPTNTAITFSNLIIRKAKSSQPWMPSASEVKSSDQPKYIGTYMDKNESDSLDPTKYTWKLNPDYHE